MKIFSTEWLATLKQKGQFVKIATITDVKASGTQGGASVAVTWTARVLNTLSDPFGLVTNLSSNQFTLPAGEYYIESTSPVFSSGSGGQRARARIRNITLGATSILGQSGYLSTGTSDSGYFVCPVSGYVNITSPTTFELQYYSTIARATDGLGAAVTDGESEVYSQIKITKIS